VQRGAGVTVAPAYVAGEAVAGPRVLDVLDPWDGSLAGQVTLADRALLDRALDAPLGQALTRWQRHEVLTRAEALLGERTDEFAASIRREAGLAHHETVYEVGRARDVLRFAAIEALHDDGQAFACDVSPNGKARRIFTLREPVGRVAAITPFNHPLNQVVHKLAPAIAAGAPVLLKPSEKTPLTAVRLVELLYEAGLPGWMLSVLVGELDEVVRPLVQDERVAMVSFTGGVAAGREVARTAGYKKLCLELGGNSPLIVHEDADLELAVKLAAEGAYRNSGQRCTAVKRLLVHRAVLEPFTEALVERTAAYVSGDPADPQTRVGTVIDEAAAERLERVVRDASAAGARVLCGGARHGAVMEPTVLDQVPRDCEMVVEESFGPLAPILAVDDLDDAIELANSTRYGLSSGVVTASLEAATRCVHGLRTGTVNVNEVPGYRTECSPFGGIKDSGLGIKEGVVEAIAGMTQVKTFSLPW